MKKRKNFFIDLIMLPLCLIIVYPFFFIVSTSLKPPSEVASNPFGLTLNLTLNNYLYVFENVPILRAFFNNVIITTSSVALIVIFGTMAAYPVVFNRNKLNDFATGYILAGFLVPTQAILLPLYLLTIKLQIYDKIYGLILLYTAGTSLAFYLCMGYMKTLPRDVFESAIIDGCSIWGVFWKVILPLLTPIVTTIVIFNTFGIWNDFLYPYLFLSHRENQTLIIEVNRTRLQFNTEWGLALAITTLVLIPLFVFYIASQKYIVKGLASGAVKG